MDTFPISAPNFAKYIPLLKKVGFSYLLFPIAIILLGAFQVVNFYFCILFSLIFLFIACYILYLGLRYERIATSQIVFANDRLEVRDKTGSVWRFIDYEDITRIQVMQLAGFMSGYHGVNGIATYVVIFLHNCTTLSHGSFHHKYKSADFFPIFYNPELLQKLIEHSKKISVVYCGNTGNQST